MNRVALLLFVCFTLHLLVGIETIPSPTVTTSNGRLIGKYVETRDGRFVQAFLGIPYAKPPVGHLRFKPPEPIQPWSKVRPAFNHPRPCLQILFDPEGSEDCLYLNVYTPYIEFRQLFPVIVFIHGGSFEYGAANGYTHEYYLDEDVVFVVIQYRLGLFGFLSTGDEVVPGNMGLKDQRCALRWVRDNIMYFGGDPSKVTIVGESAGGSSVHYLMTFAAHEGLFRAAISQSGTSLCPWTFKPPGEVKLMVKTLAKLSGCPRDSVGLVDCLRAMPALDILQLYISKYKSTMYHGVESGMGGFLPLIGPVIEPACTEDRLVTGNPWHFNTTIPWLLGVNSKEAYFLYIGAVNDIIGTSLLSLDRKFNFSFPLRLNYQNSVANGSLVPSAIREFYLNNRPISRRTINQMLDAATDAHFIYPSYRAAMRSNKNKTFFYYFDYLGFNQIFPVLPVFRTGVNHAEELLFFFKNPGLPIPYTLINTKSDTNLSKTLVRMWTYFAKYLDPTPEGSGYKKWQPFHTNNSFLYIGQDGFEIFSPFLPKRMAFYESHPFPFRNDYYRNQVCKTNIFNTTERETPSES